MKKTILITGASSGIGNAVYNKFKEDPNFVVLGASRNGPDFNIDLRTISEKDVQNIPHVDILVNCAGIMPLQETNREKEIFDVNFWGAVRLTQLLLDSKKMNRGCVLNICSVSGLRADAFLPIYAASKAALLHWTMCQAKIHAPNIRFNALSPGFYITNLVEEDTPQELIDTIPMGFEENPITLFPLVLEIIKQEYMTGSNIVIDGGVSL